MWTAGRTTCRVELSTQAVDALSQLYGFIKLFIVDAFSQYGFTQLFIVEAVPEHILNFTLHFREPLAVLVSIIMITKSYSY